MNHSERCLGIPYLKTIHSLARRDDLLYHEVLNLRPGESKIVNISKDNSNFKALLSATAFQTDQKVYKLIAFQNVNEALDETEATRMAETVECDDARDHEFCGTDFFTCGNHVESPAQNR